MNPASPDPTSVSENAQNPAQPNDAAASSQAPTAQTYPPPTNIYSAATPTPPQPNIYPTPQQPSYGMQSGVPVNTASNTKPKISQLVSSLKIYAILNMVFAGGLALLIIGLMLIIAMLSGGDSLGGLVLISLVGIAIICLPALLLNGYLLRATSKKGVNIVLIIEFILQCLGILSSIVQLILNQNYRSITTITFSIAWAFWIYVIRGQVARLRD